LQKIWITTVASVTPGVERTVWNGSGEYAINRKSLSEIVDDALIGLIWSHEALHLGSKVVRPDIVTFHQRSDVPITA
jgi:hypothetical protein